MYIVGFEVSYTKDGKPIDWVTMAPSFAEAQVSQTKERVSAVRYNPEYTKYTDDSRQAAKARWEHIESKYAEWKDGKDISAVDGTPLEAWAALDKGQVAIFKAAGIRSVEELAEATDSVIGKVRLPGARTLMEAARTYIESKGTAQASEELAAMKELMAEMQAELTELRAPKRRGRPPKTEG